MQVLILYYSRSGHTRTLAEEVARGVESSGASALLKDTSQVAKEDFTNSAGIIAGSPVYSVVGSGYRVSARSHPQ